MLTQFKITCNIFFWFVACCTKLLKNTESKKSSTEHSKDNLEIHITNVSTEMINQNNKYDCSDHCLKTNSLNQGDFVLSNQLYVTVKTQKCQN